MKKFIVLSIDTNGIPKNKNFSDIDIISISALEIDFLTMEKIKDDFFYIVKDTKINNTEKYHGFTQNDIDEYGSPLEDVVESFVNYIFDDDEDVCFDNVTFICTAAASFTIPLLENMFAKLDMDIKINKYIDLLHASHLIFNCSYFDEVLDIFNIKIPVKNSINKVNGIVKVILNMRSIICQ
jgi:hypothetical protein